MNTLPAPTTLAEAVASGSSDLIASVANHLTYEASSFRHKNRIQSPTHPLWGDYQALRHEAHKADMAAVKAGCRLLPA